MEYRVGQNQLSASQMDERASRKEMGRKVLFPVTLQQWESAQPEATGTVPNTVLQLIKVFPAEVQVNNSDTTIHVHWSWTNQETDGRL